MKAKGLVVTVRLRDVMSQPQHVKIPTKSTVAFENGEQGAQMYEISCVGMRHKPWRLKPGERYYHTFNQPGKYELVTSPQLPSKVVVEVADRYKSKKVYRQVTKATNSSENPATQAPQVQQHISGASAQADPSPSTQAQTTERTASPARDRQNSKAEPSSNQPQEARAALPDQLQSRSIGKRVRSNLLERHRRQQAAAAEAAISSDSSDDEHREAMAMQRSQRKSQAQQLAAQHGSLLSLQLHQRHQQHQQHQQHQRHQPPAFFKPAVASRAVRKQQVEQSAAAKPAPASKRAPRSKQRVLQFARVMIKDFDFNHHNVTVAVGGTLEFVLHHSCPKLAEHQLNGESSMEELRFVSPLMEAAGCRRFHISPAVEGEIRVSCQVYPDMVCLVRVECPTHSEQHPRRGVGAMPSAIAKQGTGVFTLADHGSQSSVGSFSRLDSDDETGLSGLCSGATSTCSSLDTCSASPNPQSATSTSELFAEVKCRATDADASVCVTDYGFEPSEITIRADDKLALISVSDRSHLLSCVMEDDAPLLEGVPLQLPERLVYLQFENAGTYTVQDEVFGFMKCKVHVSARTSSCHSSTTAEVEASVAPAITPILVQQNDSPVESLSEPEAIQPVETEAPVTEASLAKPGKPTLQRTSSQRSLKPKPKKQWKLKQSGASRQASPTDENTALVTQQTLQQVSEEQCRPVVTLHPSMQEVQEWFNNRMSEIELKLALHGYDSLPSGKRVPIIVL